MSELLALGISHKTAPVALRERLAFSEHEASEFALAATATAEVREAVVISTCNRTEVYLVVGGGAGGSFARPSPMSSGCWPAARRSARRSWPRRSTRHATATPRASSIA